MAMKKIDVDQLPKLKEDSSKGEDPNTGRVPPQDWTDQLGKGKQ